MSTVKHYAVIHSGYPYISSARSAFALHIEDFYLNSANILYAGAPKLWIVIDPSSKNRLESHLTQKLNIHVQCSQFVRHRYLLPRPSLLREWKIKFEVVLQPPGSLMLLQPQAYHYGLNLGANVAKAINYAESDWILSPMYRQCSRGICSDVEPLLISSMQINKPKPLKIDSTWEKSPVVPSVRRSTRFSNSFTNSQQYYPPSTPSKVCFLFQT